MGEIAMTTTPLPMDRESVLERMDKAVRGRLADSHDPFVSTDQIDDAVATALDGSGLLEALVERDQLIESQQQMSHEQDTKLAELEAERDEADRRAGAAERAISNLKDTLYRIDRQRDKWKAEAGYTSNTSFDVVWAETLRKALAYDAPANPQPKDGPHE
jgi:hypothetical protein